MTRVHGKTRYDEGCRCLKCLNINHGRTGYIGGCRCDICRAAMAEYMRGYRAARVAANNVRLPRWPPAPEPVAQKPDPDRLAPTTEWMRHAACVNHDTDLWFPEHGQNARAAKKVCAVCVVKKPCLEYALANGEEFGVWGGKSVKERELIVRLRRHKETA